MMTFFSKLIYIMGVYLCYVFNIFFFNFMIFNLYGLSIDIHSANISTPEYIWIIIRQEGLQFYVWHTALRKIWKFHWTFTWKLFPFSNCSSNISAKIKARYIILVYLRKTTHMDKEGPDMGDMSVWAPI